MMRDYKERERAAEAIQKQKAIKLHLAKKKSQITLKRGLINILILGDWHTLEQKRILQSLKSFLWKKYHIFAETINYHQNIDEPNCPTPIQSLEICCKAADLIILIDGSGPGTIQELNYLEANPHLLGKTLYFIKLKDFNKEVTRQWPYFRHFLSPQRYASKKELFDKIGVLADLRVKYLVGQK